MKGRLSELAVSDTWRYTNLRWKLVQRNHPSCTRGLQDRWQSWRMESGGFLATLLGLIRTEPSLRYQTCLAENYGGGISDWKIGDIWIEGNIEGWKGGGGIRYETRLITRWEKGVQWILTSLVSKPRSSILTTITDRGQNGSISSAENELSSSIMLLWLRPWYIQCKERNGEMGLPHFPQLTPSA